MGYEGGLFIEDEQEKLQVCKQRNQLLVQTRRLIEEHGFEVEIASAGGANTYQVTGKCSGISEIQPGSYVTMDDWNRKYGLDFEQVYGGIVQDLYTRNLLARSKKNIFLTAKGRNFANLVMAELV